eukprot:EG_transcript_3870
MADVEQPDDPQYMRWVPGGLFMVRPWCRRMQEFLQQEKDSCTPALILLAAVSFHGCVCLINGIVLGALGRLPPMAFGLGMAALDAACLTWFLRRPPHFPWVSCALLFNVLVWPLGLALTSPRPYSYLDVLVHSMLGFFLMVFLNTHRWTRVAFIVGSFGCLLVVHYWVATPTDDKTNWLLNVFIPSLFFVAVACGYSALQQFQLQQVTKSSQEEIDRLKSAGVLLRTKAGFVATLAHEVRTPLNAMLQSITLLRDSSLTEEQIELTQCLLDCGEQILDNVTSVLEFSRLQNQKLVLSCTPFSLTGLCTTCLNMIRHAAERKHVHLRQHFDLGYEGDYLVGDCGRLRQVLLNLLSNAIKFVSEGYVQLNTTTRVARHPENTVHVRFEVLDTGIGISPSNQQKLFTPYQQASSSTWENYSGTGLGLCIAKELVTMMGGTIGIVGDRTAVGRGSCFFVDLILPAITMTENLNQLASAHSDRSINEVTVQVGGRHNSLLPPSMTCPVSLNLLSLGMGLPAACSAPISPEATDLSDFEGLGRSSRSAYFKRSPFRASFSSQKPADHKQLLDACLSSSSEDSPERERERDSREPGPPVEHMLLAADTEPPRPRTPSGHRPQPAPEIDDVFAEDDILLAEDNEINLKLTGKILETLRFRKVHLVANGREALDTWLANPNIHIVLLDHQMPVMSGLEAAKQIKEHARQLAGERPAPFLIALSGAAEGELARAGVFHHTLVKPVGRRELGDLLREAKRQIRL